LRAHEPETVRRVRWLLLPKDYVRYRLTGELGTEPSDAASTLLFDPRERRWSRPLLDALEIDGALLPPVHPSARVAGGLLPAMAERVGLLPGTPVIFGGSDQAMQALGNGVVDPGVVASTIGTGGQLFAPTERPVVDAAGLRLHSFCHVLPDRWHVEAAMLAAGLSLRWLRDQVLDGVPYDALADAAMIVPPGADGLLFQPYLAGERTPHMDPQARGAFVGLTRRHGRAHLVRAVMEGVVFGMRQGLDLMRRLGVPVERVVASGGATRHPLWLQLQADIYGFPIHRTCIVEAAATGAAMLAGVGAGVYEDAGTAIAHVVRRHGEVVEPDDLRATIYERRYRVFTELYPALAPLTHALGGVRTS
jgi:xylulokinase